MAKPNLGVVLLTYNSISKLGKVFEIVLRNLLNLDYENAHVVIVDNASRDGTPDFVEKFVRKKGSRCRVSSNRILRLKKNYGWAGGNNRAVMLLKDTDYLLFLNDDLIMKPDVPKKLVEVMEQNPSIGAAQPVIINFDGTYNLGYHLSLGLIPCPITASNVSTHHLLHDNLLEIAYAIGAALMTRTELFFRLGMFTEDYFYWFDDVDYSLRVWAAGYRVVCVLNCHVYHVGSATFGKSNPKSWYYFSRNLMDMVTLLPSRVILKVIPFTIMEWFFASVLHCLKTRNTSGLIYSFLGIKHCLKRLKRHKPPRISLSSKLLHGITSPYVTAKNIKIVKWR